MSSEPELEKKMITLMSSDGETFQVDEAVAMQSETVKHLIEDVCADSAIPLSNVKAEVLSKVIEYCKMHVDSGKMHVNSGKMHVDSDNDEKDIQAWDKKFMEVDQTMLFDLIWAANYLDIKSLLDLTCQTVANMMKDKTPEAIRATFNIQNDYTPEEEAEIRRENQWAFESSYF